MILFIGAEDQGYFARKTAQLKGMDIKYLEDSPAIGKQINEILQEHCSHMIFDVEQYTTPASELAEEIIKLQRAKNCEVIIYAPGYDRQSLMVQELLRHGIKYFIYSSNPGEAREELERCLAGYYDEPEIFQEEHKEEISAGKKIGVTGAGSRIGTTTLSIQLVKYLQIKGYKACYVELNGTGFIKQHERYFNCTHDQYLGKVTYEHVDMYYKQENLLEVLKQGYDFYVFDYGTYTDTDFNKMSFLEKDYRIFVVGSKASEMGETDAVLKNEYYTDVSYVFNFISKKEQPELLEWMEEKAGDTYFTVYTPDQFEYVYNAEFERLLPVEDISREDGKRQRRGLFGWKRAGGKRR